MQIKRGILAAFSLILISFLQFASAQGYTGFSFSELFASIDATLITLMTIFVMLFALIFFALNKAFKGNRTIATVIALAMALLSTYWMNLSFNLGNFLENLFFKIGFPIDILFPIISIIFVGFLIFLLIKIKWWTPLSLGLIFIVLTFTELIYEKGAAAIIGVFFIAIGLIWLRVKKKKHKVKIPQNPRSRRTMRNRPRSTRNISSNQKSLEQLARDYVQARNKKNIGKMKRIAKKMRKLGDSNIMNQFKQDKVAIKGQRPENWTSRQQATANRTSEEAAIRQRMADYNKQKRHKEWTRRQARKKRQEERRQRRAEKEAKQQRNNQYQQESYKRKAETKNKKTLQKALPAPNKRLALPDPKTVNTKQELEKKAKAILKDWKEVQKMFAKSEKTAKGYWKRLEVAGNALENAKKRYDEAIKNNQAVHQHERAYKRQLEKTNDLNAKYQKAQIRFEDVKQYANEIKKEYDQILTQIKKLR